MKIRELLDSDDKWCQYAAAIDVDGCEITGVAEEAACAWCLSGAAERCYGGDAHERMMALLAKAIGSDGLKANDVAVIDWNDAKGRTFADVRALVERLDI